MQVNPIPAKWVLRLTRYVFLAAFIAACSTVLAVLVLGNYELVAPFGASCVISFFAFTFARHLTLTLEKRLARAARGENRKH